MAETQRRRSPVVAAGITTASTIGRIILFITAAVVCGLLAAGLMFPLAASVGASASLGSTLLDESPVELRDEPLSLPSTIHASDGTEIARFFEENRRIVEADEIADVMKQAIVSIEDERFYEHGGTDARAIARAAVTNLTSDVTEGGSTITHQYVSLLLLNADYLQGRDRLVMGGTTTVADRLNEARLAVDLEEEMTKDEILTGYLNIVLLGRQNYGVEAAARAYWNTSASELNVQQAALLAGMVQSPNWYDPELNPEIAIERRNTVLMTMLRNEYITQEEYEEAVESDLDLEPSPERNGCIAARHAQYFCDYVEREFLNNPEFGETREDREILLGRGGLRINTTLDLEAQEVAEDEVVRTVPVGDSSGAVATITSVEPETGNILTMAQSTEYNPDAEGGSGRTTVNFNVNQDAGESGGFPVGSTLKPFVAAAWVEEGGGMDDIIDASITEYDYGETWEASCLPGGEFRLLPDGMSDTSQSWDLQNVATNAEREMTVDYGLYYSVNTATVNTAYEMDLCAITDLTDRMQILDARDGSSLDPGTPSFVLGAITLSPLTLASAYATFANEGVRCDPRAISSVEDRDGNEFEVAGEECEEVLDPDVAAQVNDTLINIAEEQLADGDPDFPILGKTGTSQEGSHTWFLGTSKGVATAAQVGRTADIESLWGSTINGTNYEEFYGSTLAAPMWYRYMQEVAPNYSTDDFTEAEDSPYDDRREYRYAGNEARGPSNSNNSNNNDSNNDNDDDDDDNDDDDDDDDDD